MTARVLGVLNVTPDSFSDGGLHDTVEAAVAHGTALAAAGADIVDVGGESTRPGADRVPETEELRRTLPVVRALADRGIAVGIDTMRAPVAEAALAAGAVLVNDVSGGLADPRMAALVAATDAGWVLTHWRGPSATMDDRAVYDDVVAEVRAELLDRVDVAVAAGVRPDRIVLDPGFGFAKRAHHDVALLAGLHTLVATGFPVLAGTSRKRFVGSLTGRSVAVDRDAGTLATVVLAVQQGVWGVRVHAVAPARDAIRVVAAVCAQDAVAGGCGRCVPKVRAW
ncbi:dihydropteroate synthase [Pseudonocardia sp. ICBG1293]|uniref:dihydropteroate synthase n=1 Tax=Pseudonocardia sp. ICBG1293 TaxID=2844382 RepID=UPI001CCA6615|nr:dihydropteroate synthase [Pseudonocardia sp. ICBG1293]